MGLWLVVAALMAGGDEAPRPRIVRLSAREAVHLSLNYNVDLEVARYQPWIEDQNVLSALGAWDHVAYATASGGETISPGFSALSGASRPDNDSAGFTMGVRKALPFGASYDLSFTAERNHTNNSFVLIDPRWNHAAGLNLTFPLLRGGSTAANTSTLLVARHARAMSVDQFEKSLSDSVFQVLQAYWDLVFAIETQRVREQSLEVALRLLEDNRQKFDRGVVARVDVTQADAGVALQREGILTAEAAALNAMDRLKRLVDPALLREEAALSPSDIPRPPLAGIDEKAAVEKALAQALERRPEIRQLREQRAGQEAALARSENDLLPQLNLTGRASVNGTEGSFSRANEELRTADFRDLTVGVIFEVPLERSAARGAHRRSELERRRLQLRARSLEDQVYVEVREAVRAIRTNEKRIEANRRARELAQEQLDAELTRRGQGLSTTFRVLDVQEDLALARTNELKSMIDYNLSLRRLQQVTGSLLEEYAIVLRENLQPRIGGGGR